MKMIKFISFIRKQLILLGLIMAMPAFAQGVDSTDASEQVDVMYFMLAGANVGGSSGYAVQYWNKSCQVSDCRYKAVINGKSTILDASNAKIDMGSLVKYEHYEAEYINFHALDADIVKSVKINF